jgi:hypothetical protein
MIQNMSRVFLSAHVSLGCLPIEAKMVFMHAFIIRITYCVYGLCMQIFPNSQWGLPEIEAQAYICLVRHG